VEKEGTMEVVGAKVCWLFCPSASRASGRLFLLPRALREKARGNQTKE